MSSPTFLASLFNELCDAFELRLRQSGRVGAEQRGNRLLDRTIEERLHEVLQRRSPHGPSLHSRAVDVPLAVIFRPHMPLRLEDAELCPHRRVARITR